MHQPSYLDPLTNEMVLPWVRLHGVRGYYDIPYMAGLFPEIGQTVNLVPVLLDQIIALAEGTVVDSYQELSLKAASELDTVDKIFMARNFFSCVYETMVKPYPRYLFLWQKIQSRQPVSDDDYSRIVSQMNNQDFLDLQMWFNLTWFGYGARAKFPEVEAWIQKGSQFTESDKKELFDIQKRILKELIPLYGELARQGKIEITTSPYFHPILPLLVSTRTARRAHPNLSIPEDFAFPEDAALQIEYGLKRHEEIFGIRPKGMWPSEGSVSPEIVQIASRLGVEWMASDEEILNISRDMDHHSEGSLAEPYEVAIEGSKIRMIFRDRNLSDRIGFSYARYNGTEAAADLVTHMEQISRRESDHGRNAVISIILDGENPWEAYSDGGFHFLKTLFEKLSSHSFLKASTVSGALAKVPARPLGHLATGSWINHDFRIWIGHPEDNKAWSFLRETRIAFEKVMKEGKVVPEILERARRELFAAEGSDWFWWYGDDFQSLQSAEFDRLFRIHQQNVYRILGLPVPVILSEPIRESGPETNFSFPVDFIHPVIDGEVTHYFEWTGSGIFDNHKLQGSMYLKDSPIAMVYYGFDEENLYLRVDFDETYRSVERDRARLNIRFLDHQESRVRVPLVAGTGNVFLEREEGPPVTVQWGYRKVAEISLPYKVLNLTPGDWIGVVFELYEGETMVDQCPRGHTLSVHIPDDQFVKSIWRL
jgi:alpha-amylase/alpha-mannosidase (GH57 family)